MNVCIQTGRVVRMEERPAPEGKTLVEVVLAVSRGYNAETREIRFQSGKQLSDYLSYTLWDRNAEWALENLHKGDRVAVHSEARSNSWKNAAGEARYKVYFQVQRLELMHSAAESEA